MSKKNQPAEDLNQDIVPVTGQGTPPASDADKPAEGADLGNLEGTPPASDDTADLGGLNDKVGETADLGRLRPLAKFKKFNKQTTKGV